MKIQRLLLAAALGLGGMVSSVSAAPVTYSAFLGNFENPATGSPGTGIALVTLDDVADQLTV